MSQKLASKTTVLPVFNIWMKELFNQDVFHREQEPSLIMDQQEQAKAYQLASQSDRAFCGNHLFILHQTLHRIQPHQTVVDLCCGTGDILLTLAQLLPATEFIGVDLSAAMLDQATSRAKEKGVTNIRFYQDDVTVLSKIQTSSVDFVMSTMAIHHLPDEIHLEKLFYQIQRISKKTKTGYFLFDFTLMKNSSNMKTIVKHIAGNESEIFQQDFYFSLRAAFQKKSFQSLFPYLQNVSNEIRLKFSWLPILMMIATPKSNELSIIHKKFLRDYFHNIPLKQKFTYFLTRLCLRS